MIDGQYGYVATMGHHLEFCGRSGSAERGLALWASSLPMMETTRVDWERYWFDLGASVVLDQIDDDGRLIDGIRADVSLRTNGNDVTIVMARAWTEQRLGATAAALDRRNGNEWYAALQRRDGTRRA
jgi:hypothetical protein